MVVASSLIDIRIAVPNHG